MTDKETIEKLNAEIATLKIENARLEKNMQLLQKQIYGPKSEKRVEVCDDSVQYRLFDEAEVKQSVSEKKDEEEIVVTGFSRKKKRTFEEMHAGLPVEEEIIPLKDTTCPQCGEETVVIGKEKVRDEIVYVPAKMYVKKVFIEVRKCPKCGTDADEDYAEKSDVSTVIVKAEPPKPVLEKSMCSAELLAEVIYEKYVMATPLDRQSKKFGEFKCTLSPQTLSNWVIAAADQYFKPLYAKMHELLLKEPLVHADETVVQVLNEKGRKATTDSRMWVYCSGAQAAQAIRLYEYQPTRKGEHARNFLEGFSGYLMCDGYPGYNKLPKITRCGCWAHMRRKFIEALPTEPELKTKSQAQKGLDYCDMLYHIAHSYQDSDLSDESVFKERHHKLTEAVNDFYDWIGEMNISGKTKLSEAIHYAISQKDALTRFLENPIIPLDNNLAERTVKPFVIGRKNWLFSKSPHGADASAMIYSVLLTAHDNGLNVREFLTNLFKHNDSGLPF